MDTLWTRRKQADISAAYAPTGITTRWKEMLNPEETATTVLLKSV
jgi:hypothetical protein